MWSALMRSIPGYKAKEDTYEQYNWQYNRSPG